MYTKKEVITYYYADDGKVFTDKEECQKYEKRPAKNFKVRVWDETFEEFSLAVTISCSTFATAP